VGLQENLRLKTFVEDCFHCRLRVFRIEDLSLKVAVIFGTFFFFRFLFFREPRPWALMICRYCRIQNYKVVSVIFVMLRYISLIRKGGGGGGGG
jgi:hypothetical protein